MVGCPEEAAAWRTERPWASRRPQAVDAEEEEEEDEQDEDTVDTRWTSLANSAASPTKAARSKPDSPKARRSMEVRRAVGARGMGGRGSMGGSNAGDSKTLALLVEGRAFSKDEDADGTLLLLLASFRRLWRRGGGWRS
jgi:hypothetical protein